MRKQEEKFMEQFEKQKDALRVKKLAEQQKELLKDMNQKDVDAMLMRHKKELASIDEALAIEQARQMDAMREKMKTRNARLARDKAERQIKLAEIQKSRLGEAAAAKKHARQIEMEEEEKTAATQEARIQRCIDKSELMQNLIPKMCYSRPLMHRRLVYNLHKLNTFFGLKENAGWGGSEKAESESDLSVDSAQLMPLVSSMKNITYKTLLDHVESAQGYYDQLRDKKGLIIQEGRPEKADGSVAGSAAGGSRLVRKLTRVMGENITTGPGRQKTNQFESRLNSAIFKQ